MSAVFSPTKKVWKKNVKPTAKAEPQEGKLTDVCLHSIRLTKLDVNFLPFQHSYSIVKWAIT